MKKFILICVLIFTAKVVSAQDFPMPTAADYPKISQKGKKIEDFVPKGWVKTGEAKGDLNGDKLADAVLVVKGKSPKFMTKNENLGADVFDTNPRMLIVLFAVKDGFEFADQSNSVIATPSSPAMTEPFQAVKILNGVLQIEQEIFMSAGGWSTSQHTYKFRYQNKEFVLIGADYQSVMRNTGETESRSYNFMTRKVQISKGSIEQEKPEKSFIRSFKISQMKTLKNFPVPFEYEVEKDFFI